MGLRECIFMPVCASGEGGGVNAVNHPLICVAVVGLFTVLAGLVSLLLADRKMLKCIVASVSD